MKTNSKKSGFTLVELAIVLVIIGLIIGGVLVGQDLIKAATIRATVTDLEKFNAAATTFRGKYNGLPGDLSANKAVEFNLAGAITDPNSTGGNGLRDGDGIIEDGAGTSVNLSGETLLFWKDLGAAALIGGQYPTIGTAVAPAAAVTLANINTYIPRTRLRESSSIHVYSQNGRNFFYIAEIVAAGAPSPITEADAVTPLEAKGVDEKLDDGVPSAGVVRAHTTLAALETPAVAGTTVCAVSTTPPSYNVSSATTGAPDGVICQLQVRSSF